MRAVKFDRRIVGILVLLIGLVIEHSADGAVPNSLMLNEANTVSGSNFLDKGRADSTLGRVEGNGQNWLEFLVVQGDPKAGGGFANTLDLRGWTIEWAYDKQLTPGETQVQHGAGTIQFTDDPLWAAVPRGTMLTISEWQDAWYFTNTPAGYDPFPGAVGCNARAGSMAWGTCVELLSTAACIRISARHRRTPIRRCWRRIRRGTRRQTAVDGNGDWNLHVFAGERNPDTSFKYFNFSGSVTDGANTYSIGTDDGGLFVVNNDNWQFTIKDKPAAGQPANVIQGPIGEESTLFPNSPFGVNPTEIFRLEAFDDHVTQPTQAQYLNATINQYADGSSGTFGELNVWSSGAGRQGLAGLRNWLVPGDADLDGAVTSADYVLWRKNNNYERRLDARRFHR